MVKNYATAKSLLAIFLLFSGFNTVYSQAFQRGSWVINLSEGWTRSFYSTNFVAPPADATLGSTLRTETPSTPAPNPVVFLEGTRDPLTIEYGLTNHWGIGSTWGNDLFLVNSSSMYGLKTSNNQVKVSTEEYTVNVNYHFFVTKKMDFALTSSFGTLNVNIKGTDQDKPYQYTSKGAITRIGTTTRYYFFKHVGLLNMASFYASSGSASGGKGNTFGHGVSTKISGFSMEFGLCYRITR
jgi:hypothetical protein